MYCQYYVTGSTAARVASVFPIYVRPTITPDDTTTAHQNALTEGTLDGREGREGERVGGG